MVAVEGTHASGKTTLVHALTAHYRARGVLVEALPEPARSSPFIEQIVIHSRGDFDLDTEVDLFGAHLSSTRATRHQQLLICDKTPVNVLAYARLLLSAPAGSRTGAVLDAMASFCRAWAPGIYDATFWLPDTYPAHRDPLRARVTHLQDQTGQAVRAACADAGLTLHDVPPGLDLASRVTHLTRRVEPLLTTAAGYRPQP
ncbi:AAA domain-containing protein [Krasilnikovia cinnamomea]|uniref:AAA domain-containing protein n=1 Tax=Krasilnikovia cinnamomea TaxID=349313 RepID=A0A4Q7ZDK2_9ACTN|nr:AAA domain-containing protein [Krasilnikovia cinnamomea]